jgi:serine/threonine protein phosphatase PrpC
MAHHKHHDRPHASPKSAQSSGAASKISSFIVTAFVATTTASVSYAAYYGLTSIALFSSIAGVAGEEASVLKQEIKRDDTYNYEYVSYDTYPGIHLDDGTGVATKEVKKASINTISQAMDAAGLDENGIIKNASGEHITLHPMHVHRTTCPIYGCPFLPLDVHYEEEAKEALEKMKKEALAEESLLKTSGCENAATLTLIGYKGGRMVDQINQDRALVLSPYMYWNIKSSGTDQDESTKPVARLLGAFDGHAKFGEKVSEYVAKILPALLASKLVEFDASVKEGDEHRKMAQLLRETFLELDATSPADPSGGCTASVVLQLDSKIYVANAGDSRSFVAVHIIRPDGGEATTSIIHGTREDKPHLDIERERVEHMGGTVYLPNGFAITGQGTTRVLYKDPITGSELSCLCSLQLVSKYSSIRQCVGTSGLAMSRSIGDWDAGEVGVVPDPLVAILDINDIKQQVLEKLNGSCNNESKEVEIDASGETKDSDSKCVQYSDKDIKVFAISATDGLLDYVPEDIIAKYVAKGLYDRNEMATEEGTRTPHPLTACENLIYTAANGWQNDKGGRYRDDIAIAVADLG